MLEEDRQEKRGDGKGMVDSAMAGRIEWIEGKEGGRIEKEGGRKHSLQEIRLHQLFTDT